MTRRVRLGTGDFVPTASPNPFARFRYLQAVARCVPEALRGLMTVDDQSDEALRAWADRWGFADDWALRAARVHAPFWRDQPERSGQWISVFVSRWEPVFPPGPSWNPIAETETAFDARVDAYKATIRATAGIESTPEKDHPDDRHFEWTALYHAGGRNLEQIIRAYQEKYPDQYDGLTPGTVSGAINSVAQLIRLTLRRKQGRPKKTLDRQLAH